MRGVLVDASALVALLDRDDAAHGRCTAALATVHDPLVTVWPALAEAMHLVAGVHAATGALCDMVAEGLLTIASVEQPDFTRMKVLMAKYRDLPMDFADAVIVAVAERHGLTRIVTFDKHFAVYRLPRRARFVVLDGR